MQVSVGRLILFFWMYIWKKSSCNQRYKYSCRANFSLQNRRPAKSITLRVLQEAETMRTEGMFSFHLKPEPKGTERNHPPLVDAFFRHHLLYSSSQINNLKTATFRKLLFQTSGPEQVGCKYNAPRFELRSKAPKTNELANT